MVSIKPFEKRLLAFGPKGWPSKGSSQNFWCFVLKPTPKPPPPLRGSKLKEKKPDPCPLVGGGRVGFPPIHQKSSTIDRQGRAGDFLGTIEINWERTQRGRISMNSIANIGCIKTVLIYTGIYNTQVLGCNRCSTCVINIQFKPYTHAGDLRRGKPSGGLQSSSGLGLR